MRCPSGHRPDTGVIEFDDDYALVKTVAPDIATGVPLAQSQVRSRYGVTVVGVKRPGEGFTYATADTVVQKGDVIVITAGRMQWRPPRN